MCVCQQDRDQVTQFDLTQAGLIKAALRTGGPGTQRCFCCPAQGVFPPEGAGGGGVLLIRETQTIPWRGHILFQVLLLEIFFSVFYACFLQPLGPASPSSHAVWSRSALINPFSSVALINKPLFLSNSRPSRCFKLPLSFSLFSPFLFPIKKKKVFNTCFLFQFFLSHDFTQTLGLKVFLKLLHLW